MKTVAILQPGYLPWLGFFEQMFRCDIFIFLDDVLYTKKDWRSRNRIKTPNGVSWLTVPVLTKGRSGQKICAAEIDNNNRWQHKHLLALEQSYKKAKYFDKYFEELSSFLKGNYRLISVLDIDLILWLNEKLGLRRKIELSSRMSLRSEGKQDRILEICKKVGSDFLYDGKAAQNFIDVPYFMQRGVVVEFQDYQHPYYNQIWTENLGFISHLSIIDLLFNHGPDSLAILTGEKTILQPDKLIARHADELKKS